MNYSIAVIGGGNIAERHLAAINKMDKLTPVAVADINQDRANTLALSYDVKPYEDYEDMLQKEKPDIAVVAVPHFLHKTAAISAAENGSHILIEKPIAMNVEESEEIIEATKENNVNVLVCHTQQYMDLNMKAKEVLQSGVLGDIVMINDKRHVYYFNDDRPDWFFYKEKAGGGIVINMGIHTVDKIQWVTDSRVSTVKALLSEQSFKGNVEGSGLIHMEMINKSGKKFPASIALSGYHGVPESATEILCTYGKLKITEKELLINERGQSEYRTVQNIKETTPSILQLEDLISLIEKEKNPDEQNDYAKSVIAAIDAIYQSNDEGTEIKLY